MPPRAQKKPTRKTTDLSINPEDWAPVATWLRDCKAAGVPDHRLYLDTESSTAADRVTARAAHTTENRDIKIRLPNNLAEALAQQTRFWEACLDELPPQAKSNAPDTATFLELALDMEMSINESKHAGPRTSNTLVCTICHKPATAGGTAAVDIVDNLVDAAYKHPHCA